MERPPAVPEFLMRGHTFQLPGGISRIASEEIVAAPGRPDPVALQAEVSSGTLEGGEALQVAREHQDQRRARHLIVDDAFLLQPVPIVGLAHGADLDANHPRLVLP